MMSMFGYSSPRRKHRSIPGPIALALVAGAVAAAVALVPAWRSAPHLRVVRVGYLLASGQPTIQQLSDIVRRYGPRCVINLREEISQESLRQERDWCDRHHVRFVHLPVSYTRLDPQEWTNLASVLSDPTCQPVLVHCRSGLHRTGMVIACYRMAVERWSLRQARSEMQREGGREACERCADFLREWASAWAGRPGRGPVSDDRRLSAVSARPAAPYVTPDRLR